MMNADFCRAQTHVHQDRADSASLENVRIIAQTAATAWLKEAGHADAVAARRLKDALAHREIAPYP